MRSTRRFVYGLVNQADAQKGFGIVQIDGYEVRTLGISRESGPYEIVSSAGGSTFGKKMESFPQQESLLILEVEGHGRQAQVLRYGYGRHWTQPILEYRPPTVKQQQAVQRKRSEDFMDRLKKAVTPKVAAPVQRELEHGGELKNSKPKWRTMFTNTCLADPKDKTAQPA